jgi:hypothetical protein
MGMGMAAGTSRGSMTPRAVVLWWCCRGASWGLPGRTRHCFVTGQAGTTQVSGRVLIVRCKEDALRKKTMYCLESKREK